MYKLIITFTLIIFLNLVSGIMLNPAQSTFRIAVDNEAPAIKIISPVDSSSLNPDSPFLVNFSVSDITLSSIWYVLNNNAKIFINDSFYLALPEGSYNLTIYANDSLNRINSSQLLFIINSSSTIPPIGSNTRGSTGSTTPEKTPEKLPINKSTDKIPEAPTPEQTKNRSTEKIETNTQAQARFNYSALILILLAIMVIIFLFLLISHKRKRKR